MAVAEEAAAKAAAGAKAAAEMADGEGAASTGWLMHGSSELSPILGYW